MCNELFMAKAERNGERFRQNSRSGKPNISEAKMQTRKRGRPPQNGVKEPRNLLRSLAVLYSYDKARANGEKYIVAIRESVAFVRQFHPGMPISETEVKRILAEFRPEGAPTTLMSEYSVVEGEEARKIRSKLAVRGFLPDNPAESTHTEKDPKPLKRLTMRFTDTPNYPRHNASRASSCPPHDAKELTP
jgi:hypothetical protein